MSKKQSILKQTSPLTLPSNLHDDEWDDEEAAIGSASNHDSDLNDPLSSKGDHHAFADSVVAVVNSLHNPDGSLESEADELEDKNQYWNRNGGAVLIESSASTSASSSPKPAGARADATSTSSAVSYVGANAFPSSQPPSPLPVPPRASSVSSTDSSSSSSKAKNAHDHSKDTPTPTPYDDMFLGLNKGNRIGVGLKEGPMLQGWNDMSSSLASNKLKIFLLCTGVLIVMWLHPMARHKISEDKIAQDTMAEAMPALNKIPGFTSEGGDGQDKKHIYGSDKTYDILHGEKDALMNYAKQDKGAKPAASDATKANAIPGITAAPTKMTTKGETKSDMAASAPSTPVPTVPANSQASSVLATQTPEHTQQTVADDKEETTSKKKQQKKNSSKNSSSRTTQKGNREKHETKKEKRKEKEKAEKKKNKSRKKKVQKGEKEEVETKGTGNGETAQNQRDKHANADASLPEGGLKDHHLLSAEAKRITLQHLPNKAPPLRTLPLQAHDLLSKEARSITMQHLDDAGGHDHENPPQLRSTPPSHSLHSNNSNDDNSGTNNKLGKAVQAPLPPPTESPDDHVALRAKMHLASATKKGPALPHLDHSQKMALMMIGGQMPPDHLKQPNTPAYRQYQHQIIHSFNDAFHSLRPQSITQEVFNVQHGLAHDEADNVPRAAPTDQELQHPPHGHSLSAVNQSHLDAVKKMHAHELLLQERAIAQRVDAAGVETADEAEAGRVNIAVKISRHTPVEDEVAREPSDIGEARGKDEYKDVSPEELKREHAAMMRQRKKANKKKRQRKRYGRKQAKGGKDEEEHQERNDIGISVTSGGDGGAQFTKDVDQLYHALDEGRAVRSDDPSYSRPMDERGGEMADTLKQEHQRIAKIAGLFAKHFDDTHHTNTIDEQHEFVIDNMHSNLPPPPPAFRPASIITEVTSAHDEEHLSSDAVHPKTHREYKKGKLTKIKLVTSSKEGKSKRSGAA